MDEAVVQLMKPLHGHAFKCLLCIFKDWPPEDESTEYEIVKRALVNSLVRYDLFENEEQRELKAIFDRQKLLKSLNKIY